jgi:peptidoglycan-N-acetylglucosamine deacetylase
MRFTRSLLPIFLIALASFPAQGGQDIKPNIIEHGPRKSNRIALTFDACRTGLADEYDEKVVEILLREKVPATIFMSGRWVEKNRDKAKYLGEQKQFEIANHSYFHPHLTQEPDARVLLELKRTQALLKKVTGQTARYFRPPYGEVDERVAAIAAGIGLITIQYDIASGDPDPNLAAARIVRGVLQEARGGSIIVFHVNRHGVHTAEVLPRIIAGLREKGFELVTVGELLKKTDAGTSPAKSLGDRRGQVDGKSMGTGTGPAAAMTGTRERSTSQGMTTRDALHSGVEHTGPTESGAEQ